MAWNDNKVNGRVSAGEFVGRNMDFFTFSSDVNILPLNASGNANSQKALDKLVEVISLRGQPVLLGTPYSAGGGQFAVKFATEHSGAWTAAALKAAVIEHAPVHFANVVANAQTATVTVSNQL